MTELECLKCSICGGDLKIESENTFRCVCCGSLLTKKQEAFGTELRKTLGEEKYARVSSARRNLWTAMHEEYVNSTACEDYARELKSLVSSDYYANFAETANRGNDEEISQFLNASSASDMEMYADAVLDFMIKSLTVGTTMAVCGYIDRAFSDKTSPEYTKYINLYETEAEKVNAGIYEVALPRDVFLAYSSADMSRVLDLCEYLEGQEVSCFLAMRNLRHGRGAADNYDAALKIAMDSCRIFLYVSSNNSRKIGCDAYRIEIPYIRRKDLEGAPSEYRNISYEKLPARYKKNRIEYLLDDYRGAPTDKSAKEFFAGYEWCRTRDDVADRVITYLTNEPETVDWPQTRTQGIDDEDIQKIVSAVAEIGGTSKTRNIDEEDLKKIINAVSADRGVELSVAEKEKNVISHVKKLMSIGDYEEAGNRLSKLEDEEINLAGACSAAVYYYKILVGHSREDEATLIKWMVFLGSTLENDKDFRLALSCADSPEKTWILNMESSIESGIAEKEHAKKAEEEREREEETERNKTEYGMTFRPLHHGYCLTGIGSCEKIDLVIPSEYEGERVISIGRGAFRGNKNIRSVVIPKSIRHIGQNAFLDCFGLVEVQNLSRRKIFVGSEDNGCVAYYAVNVFSKKRHPTRFFTTDEGFEIYDDNGTFYILGYKGRAKEITLPETVEGSNYKIAGHAFYGKSGIKNIVLPEHAESIGARAFSKCKKLKSLVIRGRLGSIGEGAFSECTSLASVEITGEVESVGDNLFRGCVALSSVVFSADVKTEAISSGMFRDCTSLTDFVVPGCVKELGADAFRGCTALKSVTIPGGVNLIRENAFNGCKTLTDISVPKGVSGICDYTFYDCSSLSKIPIPDTVTTIGDSAFCGCVSLTSVIIPCSVTRIYQCAFSECSSLARTYYFGTKKDWSEIGVGYGNDSVCANVVYYSKDKPVLKGKHWHYDDNMNPVGW